MNAVNSVNSLMAQLKWCMCLAAIGLGCSDVPPRDNPLDEGGIARGAADPMLSVRYADGELVLTWARVTALEVVRYRLYRADRSAAPDGGWSLLGEVTQPEAGERVEYVDRHRLVGAPDLAWRMTIETPYGESAVLSEVAFASSDDLDGDGAIEDDCDAGDAAIFPGAIERCNSLDDDCDGQTDEACRDALAGDGEVCSSDDECVDGYCGASGLCGAWNEPCDGTCPSDLVCAGGFGVCTVACGAGQCPGAMACIDGWCLPGCGADAACTEGTRCIVSTTQPIRGGGCGVAAECDSCSEGALCVATGLGAFACCQDADHDGRLSLACAWGSDCNDSDPAVATGCGTCEVGDDCGGSQCVLLASGEGLCGGPSGCHCPTATGCVMGEQEPRCVQAGTCVDVTDCEIAAVGRWECRVVSSLGAERRCVCDDPLTCPACIIDAECSDEDVCEGGRCVQP